MATGISLAELVKDCEKYKIDKRIVIIPNHSDSHKRLMKKLDEKNITYILHNPDNYELPLERGDYFEIDFRKISLV